MDESALDAKLSGFERRTAADVVEPLSAAELYRACDPKSFDFETTADLEPISNTLGQPRAAAALHFGVRVKGEGFHVFAHGPEDADRHALVRHFVEQRAGDEPSPGDLCYLHDLDGHHAPRALRLAAGVGHRFSEDMDDFLRELRPSLIAAFESEDYQTRRQAIQQEMGEEQGHRFEELREKARERGLALIRTPAGFAFAPIRDGEVLSPDEWDQLSDAEREELETKTEELEGELQGIIRQVPQEQRKARKRLEELNRQVTHWALQDLLREMRERYGDYPGILEHLDRVEADVVENVDVIVGGQDGGQGGMAAMMGNQAGSGGGPDAPILRRYRVNLLVNHGESEHAPVIYEDHPTYQNLVGRVEYRATMGALITDHNLIQPGALHRANGGYLILDARQVLLQPLAWEELKRVLQSGEIRIESPHQMLGLVRTVSLEPEPVELDVKVVLVGSPILYYLLSELDPDFPQLFKVAADVAEEMDRDAESESSYARLLARFVEEGDLLPFDRTAVARVVERSARSVGDAEKLSARTENIRDLMLEASHWAQEDGADVVTSEHVQRAVDEWTFRSDRLRERIQEEILRDILYIDTRGSAVGQVNGLSVIEAGGFRFGRPHRITARTRLGEGEVVDIEREVELGGPIHSKGVMILAGFLGARFASETPLSLSATLVFEQSYGGIEGDSASSTELYALLSSIAGVPVRQSVAVTGSVNQHGVVQPIGGVNEKIEGFFDICAARGLTGDQGVIIPAANRKHLMLRRDVVDAVDEGRFQVWPVETVSQGMEILTGVAMGERDAEGRFPEGTLSARIEERLRELAERHRHFARPAEDGDGNAGGDGNGAHEDADDG